MKANPDRAAAAIRSCSPSSSMVTSASSAPTRPPPRARHREPTERCTNNRSYTTLGLDMPGPTDTSTGAPPLGRLRADDVAVCFLRATICSYCTVLMGDTLSSGVERVALLWMPSSTPSRLSSLSRRSLMPAPSRWRSRADPARRWRVARSRRPGPCGEGSRARAAAARRRWPHRNWRRARATR